jgi:inosine-uridine nucleoside N-ribohydrolase
MKSLPILIDCDPGADDTFALLRALILHSKDNNPLQIKAITTSGGNVSADKTYLNAHRMSQFVKATNIPIGKDLRPVKSSGDASHIHGNDGIGNLSYLLADPKKLLNFPADPFNSVDLIIETIKNNPGLTILATGPMTNLAAAEQQESGILNQCNSIIAMGGANKVGGNVTPVAEFNVWYDAPAAQYVSDHCDNLVMIPLDVTTSFVYSPQETEHIL